MCPLETDVDLLLQSSTFGEDPFASFVERSRSAGLPEIQVSTVFGRFLELVTRLTSASLIVEVGTLGGYSAAWMARGFVGEGRIISLEIDAHHADVARENLRSVNLASRVDVRVGAALETFPRLREDAAIAGHVDLSFIDADKVNNPHYVNAAVELSRPGAVIIVDNVVRGGSVLDANSDNPMVVGSRDVLALL